MKYGTMATIHLFCSAGFMVLSPIAIVYAFCSGALFMIAMWDWIQGVMEGMRNIIKDVGDSLRITSEEPTNDN